VSAVGPPRRGRLRAAWLAVALLTAAAAAPRAWPIAERALWFDEASTVYGAQQGPVAMVRWEHHYEHPPLSYALVWLSMRIFGGRDEWIVRLPSLLAGVACVPLIFLLGLRLGGPALGLAAALLLALDPNLVSESQQARMYTSSVVALILCALPLPRLCSDREPSPWAWVGYGLLLALAFLTSLFGVVLWVAALATLVLRARRRAEPRALLSGGALAFAFAASLCHVGIGRLGYRLFVEGPLEPHAKVPWSGALSEALRALGELFGSPFVTWPVLAVGLAGLLLLRRSGPLSPLLLALFAVNLAILVPLREIHQQVSPRYATALEVPVFLGLGAWVALPRSAGARSAAWAALAALALWMGGYSLRAYVLDEPRFYAPGETARLARDRVGPEDGFVYFPDWLTKLGWYYGLEARPPCRTPTTWVFFAHLRWQGAEAVDLLADLAARCDARFGPAAWLQRLATEDAVLVRIERGGAVLADAAEAGAGGPAPGERAAAAPLRAESDRAAAPHAIR
jgi:4-amino-4-deoxy-L-arabinose transferase-like glycosyltransferase